MAGSKADVDNVMMLLSLESEETSQNTGESVQSPPDVSGSEKTDSKGKSLSLALDSARQVKRSKRTGLKGSLTKLTNSLKKWIDDPDLTLAQLESAYNKAQKSYDELCEVNFALMALYLESSPEAEECQKYMDNVYETYERATFLYEKARAKLQEGGASYSNISKSATGTVKVKLSPLPCPKWDLDIRKYAEFKGTFQELVERNTTPSSALFYLREAVPEAARGILSGCTVILEGWKVLDERYGDEQIVAAVITKELRDTAPIREGQDSKLLVFIEGLQKSRLDMKRIGLESELSHSSTVNIVEEKLPKVVVDRWRRLVVDEGIKLPSLFPRMMDFLQKEARLIRAHMTNVSVNPSKSSVSALESGVRKADAAGSTPDNDHVLGRSAPAVTGTCLFHDNTDSHELRNCRVFSNLLLEGRRKFILNNKLCGICLEKGHFRNNCKARPVCPIEGCGARHVRGAHGFMAPEIVHGKDSVASRGCPNSVGARGVCVRPVVESFLRSEQNGSEDAAAAQFTRLVTLMDGGASTSLIVDSRAKQAGLRLVADHLTLLEIEVVGGEIDIPVDAVHRSTVRQILPQGGDGKGVRSTEDQQ